MILFSFLSGTLAIANGGVGYPLAVSSFLVLPILCFHDIALHIRAKEKK